jgi:hypothetical protein
MAQTTSLKLTRWNGDKAVIANIPFMCLFLGILAVLLRGKHLSLGEHGKPIEEWVGI